jgi:hypothetical protein
VLFRSLSGSANPATITMNANQSVSANFALKTYTITASAGANGAISPSGAVTVNYGACQSFTITANSGYTVDAVTVDGANQGSLTSYAFCPVTASHTINVTFKASTSTLTLQTVSTSAASSAITASTLAHDGNTATRWESTQGVDPQWIRYDLGSAKPIVVMVIDWEAANAKNYTIEGSNDATFATKTTLITKTNMPTGQHRIDSLTGLTGSYRYYRMYGTARNLTYGYSIWETRFYTSGTVTNPGTLQFAAATYAVAENSGSVNLIVNRVNGSDGTVSINYATANGTATSGSDYTSKSGTLTFGPGVTSQTVSIAIIDDAVAERARPSRSA